MPLRKCSNKCSTLVETALPPASKAASPLPIKRERKKCAVKVSVRFKKEEPNKNKIRQATCTEFSDVCHHHHNLYWLQKASPVLRKKLGAESRHNILKAYILHICRHASISYKSYGCDIETWCSEQWPDDEIQHFNRCVEKYLYKSIFKGLFCTK